MPAEGLAEAPPRPRGFFTRLADIVTGKVFTLSLAVLALVVGLATFAALSGGTPIGPTGAGQLAGVILANIAFLLLLVASLAARLTRMWLERRRGAAGSRLHVRLVLLFGVVAAVPALLVAGFAALFFNLGIQAWFSDRVRDTLEASLVASRGYLDEHRNTIRADILFMANDLNRAAQVLLPDNGVAFARLLATHTALRGLTSSIIFEPVLGQVVANAGLGISNLVDLPPGWALEAVRSGEVVVLPSEAEEGRVRAMVQLNIPPGLVLLITRPLDPSVLGHMRRTEISFNEYNQLDRNRGSLQITFFLIFAIATLLVLLAAVLIGLLMANRIARPISRLILAAERVRSGDLATKVEEGEADDEIARLARSFNRMTSQLGAQRAELMNAYSLIDERRRFTETVLSGVSAGVVGLDSEGRVTLPNRSASALLGVDLDAAIGLSFARIAPEFAELLAAAAANPERPRVAEILIGPANAKRTLLARIGTETLSGRIEGYVLTFDDITELQSAQRKAAWADVARRIAHEIKNPLTPIQLSAERLKRRYLRQITDDPDTFRQCTDTIVRQVEDIGRMVDEFSAFARMPQPVIKPEDANRLMLEALVLQRNAHPDIAYDNQAGPEALKLPCDRRLIGQALTNLLQNAADAIAMREEVNEAGRIETRIIKEGDMLAFQVMDNGIGLPPEEPPERLTEPYVTHKPKGTGLGLAIVKKIMEDHGGSVSLAARPEGSGTIARLVLPLGESPWHSDGSGAKAPQAAN
jgi:two-component system nitrogen regulation sensor histidine kinase NtrY